MKLPEHGARPGSLSAIPSLATHLFNIAIPIAYAIIFTTPIFGVFAAIKPVL